MCEVEKPLVLTADRFWSGQEGSPALVELTIMQKATCYDLVYHHHQLLSVLFFIAHLNLKNMKPLSCFDGKVSVMSCIHPSLLMTEVCLICLSKKFTIPNCAKVSVDPKGKVKVKFGAYTI